MSCRNIPTSVFPRSLQSIRDWALINAIASPQTGTGQTLMGLLGVGAEYGILLPYGRVQESEADILGLDLMAKAGFDPRESVKLWVNMGSADQRPAPGIPVHPPVTQHAHQRP